MIDLHLVVLAFSHEFILVEYAKLSVVVFLENLMCSSVFVVACSTIGPILIR